MSYYYPKLFFRRRLAALTHGHCSRVPKILFSVLSSVVIVSICFSQEWYHNGPNGVWGLSVAICPYDTTKLYLGTEGRGVFFSDNGGTTWIERNSNLPEMRDTSYTSSPSWWNGQYEPVRKIWIDPYHSGVAWLSTYRIETWLSPDSFFVSSDVSSLFYTQNFGESWALRNTGLPDSLLYYQLAFDSDSSTIYIVCDNGFYFSTNNGLTWDIVEDIPNDGEFKGVSVAADGTVFASYSRNPNVEHYNAIFALAPGDVVWEFRSEVFIGNIACHPSNSQILWGSSFTPLGYSITLASFDGGVSWNEFSGDFLGLDALGSVYKSDGTSVYISTNQGTTWQPVFNGITSDQIVSSISSNPLNGNTILFPCKQGLLVSYNQGTTFSYLDSNIINSYIYSISTHPSLPLIAYSAGLNGISKTCDGGVSWNNLLSGSFKHIVIDPQHPDTIYATGKHLYRSFNAGYTWSHITTSNFSNECFVAIHPDTTSIVYSIVNNELFVSYNNLDISYPIPSPVSQFDIINNIYISHYNYDIYIALGRLLHGYNNYNDWDVLINGFTQCFKKADNHNIYTYVAFNENYLRSDIYISNDNLNTFINYNSNLNVFKIWDFTFCSNGYIYTATSDSICYMNHNGVWSTFQGFYNARCRTIAFSCDEQILYVGTNGYGVYSGHSIVNVNDDIHSTKPDNTIIIECYPNPFNSSVSLSYYLPYNTNVRLSIYNNNGQQVALLVNHHMVRGRHSINWDASSSKYNNLASGVYYILLDTNYNSTTKKLLYIK